MDELLRIDWLEALGGELIIGVEGEFTVNSREFFSVFKTEPVFKVVHAGKTVGEIPYSLQVQEQKNLFLASRTWKITGIDVATKRIEVIPARDGKRPIFSGVGGTVHPRIREKMLEILISPDEYPELDELSRLALRSLRQQFAQGLAGPAHPRAPCDNKIQRPDFLHFIQQ